MNEWIQCMYSEEDGEPCVSCEDNEASRLFNPNTMNQQSPWVQTQSTFNQRQRYRAYEDPFHHSTRDAELIAALSDFQ
jgi:hypothetical protein